MPRPHIHQSYELYFLVSGQRRYFVGHSIFDLSPGNLMIVPKNQLHRAVKLPNKGYERFVVDFYEEDHQFFIDQIGRSVFDELMQASCLRFPPHIAAQIQHDLQQLEKELAARSAYTRAVTAHLLYDILLIALRSGIKKQPCQGETAENIQSIAKFISTHYAEMITLDQAAEMAHMEKTYFSKRFKNLTGYGFLEYLTQTRLREAQRLLLETTLSISQVAELCGFSSSNYFGDIFRRWKGVSPSDFRKNPPPEFRVDKRD